MTNQEQDSRGTAAEKSIETSQVLNSPQLSPTKGAKRLSFATKRKLLMVGAGLLVGLAVITILAKQANNSKQVADSSPTPTPNSTPTPAPVAASRYVLLNIDTLKHAPLDSIINERYWSSLDNGHGQTYIHTETEVKLYDPAANQIKTIYTVPEDGYQIDQLSLGSDGLLGVHTYKITGPEGEDYNGNAYNSTHNYLDIMSATGQNIKRLGQFQPVLYGRLAHVGPTSKGDYLLVSRGGDSCAGYAFFFLASQGLLKFYDLHEATIQRTGDGCTSDPRYLGYSQQQDSLILFSVVKEGEDKTGPQDDYKKYKGITLDKLYLKNAHTGQETTVMDLKKELDGFRVKQYESDSRQQKLYLTSADGMVAIVDYSQQNSTTASLVISDKIKSVITERQDSGYTFRDQHLYLPKSSSQQQANPTLNIEIINILTGTSTTRTTDLKINPERLPSLNRGAGNYFILRL